MKSLTKKILIFVIGFLLLLEAIALFLPGMPVISHVARDYRLKVFSIPFTFSALVSHFWIKIMEPSWWNPIVWAGIFTVVVVMDFTTTWQPSNSVYVVIAGLVVGLFWPQKNR